jgi:hypothetical protein
MSLTLDFNSIKTVDWQLVNQLSAKQEFFRNLPAGNLIRLTGEIFTLTIGLIGTASLLVGLSLI